jgi:uncharacterized protein (DUF2342 family)
MTRRRKVAGVAGAVGNLWIKKAGCWQRAVRIRSWVATEPITQSGNFSRLAWLHENAVATERAIVFQPWWSSIMYKNGHEEISIEQNIHPKSEGWPD